MTHHVDVILFLIKSRLILMSENFRHCVSCLCLSVYVWIFWSDIWFECADLLLLTLVACGQ